MSTVNSQQDYQEPEASAWPTARHQCGLQSQFGSPESLDPREDKNVGLLFSSGRLFHPFPSSLSIHGRRDSLHPGGNKGPGGTGGNFWSQWR